MAVNLTQVNNWLKEWYLKGDRMNAALYGEDAFLARIKRMPATQVVGGKEIVVPIRSGRNPNQSKKFANAQAGAKARTGTRDSWKLKVDSLFGVVRVENKTILASKNDKGAFVKMLKDELDDCMARMAQKRCREIFAPKPNLIGTVKAVQSAQNTFDLNLVNDAVSFEIGDQVDAYTPAGVRRGTTAMNVTAVNRQNGKISVTANASGLAQNDELYYEGDRGEATLSSLAQWIPEVRTGLGTAFNGVVRNKDPQRLAGHFFTKATSDDYAVTIRKAASQINQLTGRNPSICVVNPLVENAISVEQKDNIRFDQASGKGAADMAVAGVRGLGIATSKGVIEIVQSSYCPTNIMYVLDEMDLKLYYLAEEGGDFIFFDKNPAGGIFEWAGDQSAIEARLSSYGDFAIQSPANHAAIKLTGTDVPSFS